MAKIFKSGKANQYLCDNESVSHINLFGSLAATKEAKMCIFLQVVLMSGAKHDFYSTKPMIENEERDIRKGFPDVFESVENFIDSLS